MNFYFYLIGNHLFLKNQFARLNGFIIIEHFVIKLTFDLAIN